MTFNEWWAGQNLPESSKAVALAAWYAHQLYGERIVQPVGFHSHFSIAEACGHQLDAIGEQLGVIREHDTHGVETDQSYRERIQQKQSQMITREHDKMITKPRRDECRYGGAHQWDSFEMLGGHSEVRCTMCGERPA